MYVHNVKMDILLILVINAESAMTLVNHAQVQIVILAQNVPQGTIFMEANADPAILIAKNAKD